MANGRYELKKSSYQGHPTIEVYDSQQERRVFRGGYWKWKALMDPEVIVGVEQFLEECEQRMRDNEGVTSEGSS